MKYGTLEEISERVKKLEQTLEFVVDAAKDGDLAATYRLLGIWRYELGEIKVVVQQLGEQKK